MTLKEIAKEAGVSVSTVSRVVNSRNDSFASKEVRDRIWAIVKKSGYLPNKSARELQQGKKAAKLCAAVLCAVYWAAPIPWKKIHFYLSFQE